MRYYRVTATEDHVMARCALREMPQNRRPYGWHAPCCLGGLQLCQWKSRCGIWSTATRATHVDPGPARRCSRRQPLVRPGVPICENPLEPPPPDEPRAAQSPGRLGRQSPESSDIYAAAVDAAILTLRGDRAAILELDDTGIMRFRAWRGLSGEYRASATGYSPWAPEATDHRSVRVPDTLADPSLGSLRAANRAEGIRALAYVPLVSQQGLLGGLVVYYDTPHDFSAGRGADRAGRRPPRGPGHRSHPRAGGNSRAARARARRPTRVPNGHSAQPRSRIRPSESSSRFSDTSYGTRSTPS